MHDFESLDLDGISMDELMAQFGQPAKVRPGAFVRGKVVAVDSRKGVWVDFGGKTDGLVPCDGAGADALKVGDEANFMVAEESDDDLAPVSLSGPAVAEAWLLLQEHVRTKQPIEATLGRPVRSRRNDCAGARATVGPLHGFIPYSLLAIRSSELESRHGETIHVFVLEADPEHSGKLILDHKTYIQDVVEQERATLFDSLTVGASVTGTVVKFADYGVFVDIGSGLQGLLHRTEISNDSGAQLESLVKKGQNLQLRVIRKAIDEKSGKRQLAFSLKQAKQDEFLLALEPDTVVTGIVRRLTDFGAFVELSADHFVDGLLHRSQYNNAIRHGRKTLQPGEVLRVKVLSVDRSARRVQLSLRDVAQDETSTLTAAS